MLTKRLAVYVPSKIGQAELPREEREFWLKHVLAEFSHYYGGATAVDGHGCWLVDSGELVMEKVTIVYTFAEESADVSPVYATAERLASALRQEAVAIEVNGGMDFVAGREAVA